MDYIDRLPVIISLSASILIGFISYNSDVDTGKIHIILSVSLVIFYIVGLLIRSTVRQVAEQVAEAENQRLEEEKRLEKDKRLEEENKLKTNEKAEAAPSIIDYSVGSNDDEFIPFQFEKDTNEKERTASVK